MGAQHGGATASGPASGSDYEIILQGFNWESHRQPWYKVRPAIKLCKLLPPSKSALMYQLKYCRDTLPLCTCDAGKARSEKRCRRLWSQAWTPPPSNS